jgi:hypothetical protein
MSHKQWGFLTVAVTMVLTIAAAGRGWADPSSESPQKIGVHVDSVVASDTHQGVDAQLSPMEPRLHSLFNYTTYHMVNHQEQQTPMGTLVLFNLPGGRILHVQPRGIDGDMIVMELILFQGQQPLMTTELKLRNHGVLIVGGPRYEEGMLILSIGADCRCPRPRTADAGAAQMHSPAASPQAAVSE